MTKSDAEKWNQRYQSAGHNLSKPRPFLAEQIGRLPKNGLGLDVAMGLGHNADLLSRHGLTMIGVDISERALYKVRYAYPAVQPVLCDLPEINFAPVSFDVILNFWFLERDLFPAYHKWLKPGGFLFFETMRQNQEEQTSQINPGYFLKPGELLQVFGDWNILIYDENVEARVRGEDKLAVQLLVQKPF
ncbi:MAG: hypothetical protein CL609_11145 [Anaerolineaceae bacterium]|nr:hypothetical protein [Anaerolineaceae bacterium]